MQIKLRREWFFSRCFFNDPIACKSLHNKSIKRNRPPPKGRVTADVETQWHQCTWHRDIQGHWENIMFVLFARSQGFYLFSWKTFSKETSFRHLFLKNRNPCANYKFHETFLIFAFFMIAMHFCLVFPGIFTTFVCYCRPKGQKQNISDCVTKGTQK